MLRSSPRPLAQYALAAVAMLLLGSIFLVSPKPVNASPQPIAPTILLAQAQTPTTEPDTGPDGVQNSDDDQAVTNEDGDVSFGRCTVSTSGGVAQYLGYILCPVIETILDSIEWTEKNIVVPYLSVSPLQSEDDQPLYELWKIVRNIANVALVVGFMYLVFTQTTSLNSDAYAVKRMAPRLILVTIGIQLSFFGAALIVDVFNLLGVGVGQITKGLLLAYGDGTIVNLNIKDASDAGMLLLLGLGAKGMISAIGSGSLALSPIIGFFIAAFFIIIAVVVTLVLRQILIAALVIVSPIAIAAALLPNTEKVFQTWRSWLTKSLMMYPLIIGLFAMGKIFGMISSNVAGSGPQADGVASIIGFMANIVPLVIIPFTFRLAGGVIAGVMNFAQARGKTLQSQTSNLHSPFMRQWNEHDESRFADFQRRKAHGADGWHPKHTWSKDVLARSGRAGEYYRRHRTRRDIPMYGLTKAGRHAGLKRYASTLKEQRELFSDMFTTPGSHEASMHFLKHASKGERGLKQVALDMMNNSDDPYNQQIGRNLFTMAGAVREPFFIEAAAMHATSGSKMGTFSDTRLALNEAAKNYMVNTGGDTWRFRSQDSYREYDRLLQAVSKSGGRSMITMGKIGAFRGESWDSPIDFSQQDAFSWGGQTKGLQKMPDLDRKTNYGIMDAMGDVERYGMGQINNNAAAEVIRGISEDSLSGKFGKDLQGGTDAQRAAMAAKHWSTMMSGSMSSKTRWKVMQNLAAVHSGHLQYNNGQVNVVNTANQAEFDKYQKYAHDLGPSAVRFLQHGIPTTGQNGEQGQIQVAKYMFDQLSGTGGHEGEHYADEAGWENMIDHPPENHGPFG